MKADAEYEWLEEVDGTEALTWVEQRNAETLSDFQADANFSRYQDAALEILEADDRIAFGLIRGDQVYNFWQDADHVRGLWRRVSRAGYEADKNAGGPAWEIVLDIDQLAETEEENWVWKGAAVNADYSKAMVMLSRGGKDATVVREFDLVAKIFVEGGFGLAEAKSFVDWIDDDTLLVGTDFGRGSLTESGYPAITKRWSRGRPLGDAVTIHEVDRSYVLLSPSVQHRPEGTYISLVSLPDFFSNEVRRLEPASGTLTMVDLPADADFQGYFNGRALAVLRSEWHGFSQGSLIALDLDDNTINLIYQPDERSSVAGVATTRDAIVFAALENVVGSLYVARPTDAATDPGAGAGADTVDGDAGWRIDKVPIDGLGTVDLISASDDSNECFVSYNDFLTPPSLMAFTTDNTQPRFLKRQPSRFDAAGLITRQCFATSADGTRIPYFVIFRQQNESQNESQVEGRTEDKSEGSDEGWRAAPGPARTILYGYGGFEIPMTPSYASSAGRLWLERGGTYVVANIRGGGEFGPAWHQAALKLNRHKAFEDFEAVAADLVTQGFTTPDRLAIKGGSNGGLLVGSVFTRSPDLCAGVICAVPLLDMMRYHLLLAGASWTGEYGDPTDPDTAQYLASYSPFQQVNEGVDYPTVFFVTSTRDDRVHPGHARKMVARMVDQGHSLHYYENTEGGHSAGANLKQQARLVALEYVYLDRVLVDPRE